MNRNRLHKQVMSNSLQLSEEGIKIAQEAFRCKYSSQDALADKLSEVHQCTVTRQPIGRFLKGQSIRRQIFVWICEELDVDVNKVVKPLSEPKPETTAIEYWHKICREMLESQKRSIRRQATEIVSEPFYVQLGLVERRHQPRRGGDFSLSPEQGSGFFQLDKEEIIETYEHDEFLEQVIKQGQSKKSKGKRIAIIGEPGAGKTTLLEASAFSRETPGLPIWISLGSLGEKSLEEYLCQKWLKDALKTSDVTQQHKELEELFKSGEVLLLLDGVDEMPAPSPVEALAKIREELTGWVAGARVVLTCRVNVWDASVNALQGFDTYRTLEFSYGDGNKCDRVREFICQWFSNTDKPELGEPLREKLDEDRHQRIRDLVKNPLRLSLLCQSWYFRQGDLPETKAALYEQFTRAFYDWKEEQFPITPTKRKELNAALGLLAREAIDKEKSRFGIRESFAIDVMREDLFNLACKLHWLVHIYNDAATGQPVYAFFHPTFQEYFAACAIDDWNYFLNHNNDNPNPFLKYNNKDCMYRIFERQWKEVILLWIGRPEDEVQKPQKEEFIKALLDFEDGCDSFYYYWHQAYYLIYDCFDEFWECSLNEIIAEEEDDFIIRLGEVLPLHKRGFGYIHYTGLFFSKLWHQGYQIHDDWLEQEVQQNNLTGVEASIERLDDIDALIERLGTHQSVFTRWKAVKKLGKLASGNPSVTTTLIEQLYTRQDEDTYRSIAFTIAEVASGNLDVANALIHLLRTNPDKLTREAATESLFIICRKGNLLLTLVSALKDCLRSDRNLYRYCHAVLWLCAQKITYPDFYYAWHGQRSTVQPLENQFINIPSQIQPSDKTYPIAIDTQSLKLETNTSALAKLNEVIAQKLCTKIYRKAGYSDIPTVNDAAQLQQYIPRIQEKLQKPNLALILHGCEPNEHLLNFCYSLADPDIGLYIGLITSKPIEQPLKGFLPNQDNLLSAIQTWINEIG